MFMRIRIARLMLQLIRGTAMLILGSLLFGARRHRYKEDGKRERRIGCIVNGVLGVLHCFIFILDETGGHFASVSVSMGYSTDLDFKTHQAILEENCIN